MTDEDLAKSPASPKREYEAYGDDHESQSRVPDTDSYNPDGYDSYISPHYPGERREYVISRDSLLTKRETITGTR